MVSLQPRRSGCASGGEALDATRVRCVPRRTAEADRLETSHGAVRPDSRGPRRLSGAGDQRRRSRSTASATTPVRTLSQVTALPALISGTGVAYALPTHRANTPATTATDHFPMREPP